MSGRNDEVGVTPRYRNRALATDEATSKRMKRVRRSGTDPELVVRSLLRDLGTAYRIRNPDLPGNPDLANRKRRWAIFVHGCFWHGHSNCSRAKLPVRNQSYWSAKIQRNRARDVAAIRALRLRGFAVLVIWECELRDLPLLRAQIAARLQDTDS